LVRQAKILLLDEPLANLDPQWRAQLREDISVIRENLQATFIYVTHDHLDATLTADRIAVLRAGHLQQIAAPHHLYEQPENIFVAEFFGFPAVNLFSGHLVRHLSQVWFRVSAAASDASTRGEAGPNRFLHTSDNAVSHDGKWSVQLDNHWSRVLKASSPLPAILGIRPEHISCVPPSPEAQMCSAVAAAIHRVQKTGPEAYLCARAAGIPFVARASAGFRADVGDGHPFYFETKSACLFDTQTGARLVPS
jgi:multiple sugar transport system ATP-binding protein